MIQSPASRAARRSSCQVRSGLVGEGPREEPEGEPARSRGGPRRTGARRANRSGVGRSLRVAALKPARDGGHQRPADAVDRADAGRDALLALEVRRVGEAREARRAGRAANASGSSMSSARLAPSASAAGRCVGDEATARSVVALVGGRVGVGSSWASSRASVGRPSRRVHRFGRVGVERSRKRKP